MKKQSIKQIIREKEYRKNDEIMRIPIVSKWWDNQDLYSQAGIALITVCVVGLIFFPITIPIALYYGHQEKKGKRRARKAIS